MSIGSLHDSAYKKRDKGDSLHHKEKKLHSMSEGQEGKAMEKKKKKKVEKDESKESKMKGKKEITKKESDSSVKKKKGKPHEETAAAPNINSEVESESVSMPVISFAQIDSRTHNSTVDPKLLASKRNLATSKL